MPQVKVIEVNVLDPVQMQIQVRASLQLVIDKFYEPMKIGQPLAVDLIDKHLKGRLVGNFQLEGMRLICLLTNGKISMEEYSSFVSRGVLRISAGLPHESRLSSCGSCAAIS